MELEFPQPGLCQLSFPAMRGARLATKPEDKYISKIDENSRDCNCFIYIHVSFVSTWSIQHDGLVQSTCSNLTIICDWIILRDDVS